LPVPPRAGLECPQRRSRTSKAILLRRRRLSSVPLNSTNTPLEDSPLRTAFSRHSQKYGPHRARSGAGHHLPPALVGREDRVSPRRSGNVIELFQRHGKGLGSLQQHEPICPVRGGSLSHNTTTSFTAPLQALRPPHNLETPLHRLLPLRATTNQTSSASNRSRTAMRGPPVADFTCTSGLRP